MPIIRLAAEKDITRILELYKELVITTSQVELCGDPSTDGYLQVFAQIHTMPGQELLVIEEGGNVVGVMVLLIVPNLSHGGLPWAFVDNLIIDHRHRRRGLGRLLMDKAVARAKEAGCYKIVLTCDKRLEGEHKFYRSLGFEASAHGFRLYF